MESHGGIILAGETEELGEKPVPVPLYAPQIPHGLTRARTKCLCNEKPATNCLSHGQSTALLSSNIYLASG